MCFIACLHRRSFILCWRTPDVCFYGSLFMSSAFRFHQLDVFTDTPTLGNPLAVVHNADPLSDQAMAAFARWTNLSETTFLLQPTQAGADYRVRIFTPGGELPFAGHPTLGSCHAWLAAAGTPASPAYVVQQCGVGLVRIRRDGPRLAFAAPALRRTGPLDAALVQRIVTALGVSDTQILATQWVDNGPGWCAVLLDSAATVLELKPDYSLLHDLKLGVVGAYRQGGAADFEVRAFVGPLGITEDPVTGSLNAGIAQWLIGEGLAASSYVASQGTVLGRRGRVYIDSIDNDIWVGGHVAPCIEGTVTL
jgi:PhzF family phenazine biosynthesis protein